MEMEMREKRWRVESVKIYFRGRFADGIQSRMRKTFLFNEETLTSDFQYQTLAQEPPMLLSCIMGSICFMAYLES